MNKIYYHLVSIFAAFILVMGSSYNASASSIYGLSIPQSQVTELLTFPEAEELGANTFAKRSGSVDEITIAHDSVHGSKGNRIEGPTSIPTLTIRSAQISELTRPMKYYGVDRGSPFTDSNYAILAQHAVKTIIVDTFINDASNGSSAKWSNIKALATKYNFNYVIWPNQGGDVPGCGWETPFNSPQSGDYIWRVTTMLDSFAADPHFVGMVSAHEPMWNTSTCKTSISDMSSIKTQLKNYMQTKGRADFKVWNYIDNVSDLKNMSGFSNADIERVMDVAVTWQHCFGGAEGTCSGAKNKIIADRALINNAGLNGKVDLVYLFQTFATGGGYSMPTLADMQTWDCQFIATNALDGFMYYTWGAWYSTDLSNHPELWPEMNRVYDSCINQAGTTITSTPNVTSTAEPTQTPSLVPTAKPTNTSTVTSLPAFTQTQTATSSATPTSTKTFSLTSTPSSTTLTPTSTPTPTPTSTPLPANEPSVSTIIIPTSINVGQIATVNVNLNNIPVGGYTSAEFTCTYNPALVEVSNIVVTNLFGADPVAAINGPQNGSIILAIAGSNGNRVTVSGTAFTFSAKGLQTGQTVIECKARVSKGDNILADIPSTGGAGLSIGSVPTATPTPLPTFTPTPLPAPVITGQVLASKPVTIRLYNADNSLAATVNASPDGTFNFTAPAGTYTITATASGFLNAQGSITLTNGITRTMTTVALPAGDIDGNGVIDQFDAMTIGMSYNTAIPPAADLNNDGTINVLDLELLAANHRKAGAVGWQ